MRLVATSFTCHAPTTLLLDCVPIADCGGHGQHSDESIEHARRMAACWNAFEGIPVENIERFGKAFAQHGNAVLLWNAAKDAGVFK